ncbi:hypothetical protein V7266_30590 [Neobacillus drentensis]|uniref:hypothetical protein n=1 Tax=Neobacillus drentensis TaxID=220684 RepID=UPI002FFEBB21
MHGAFIFFLLGFLSILIGWIIFWQMDDSDEPFWLIFLEALSDIVNFNPNFLIIGLLFWVLGFLLVLLGIGTSFNPAILNIFSSILASV